MVSLELTWPLKLLPIFGMTYQLTLLLQCLGLPAKPFRSEVYAMARARLHLICGNCGCNDMWKYHICVDGNDIDGVLYPAVRLLCGNCTTLHNLDSNAKNENPAQRLTEIKD